MDSQRLWFKGFCELIQEASCNAPSSFSAARRKPARWPESSPAIPGLLVELSLAGRTRAPAEQPVPVRVGGFGGAEGLATHLRQKGISILIDATHPHAAQISRNAAQSRRDFRRPAGRPATVGLAAAAR
jgi:hypothetical protein